MKKVFGWIKKHKLIAIVSLFVLLGVGYFVYSKIATKEESVRYVTAAAEKGVLISTISGTGQVSAVNQVDIAAEASGKVISVGNVVAGQEVKAGTFLFQLNASEALKSVRDAQSSLASAQLSLKKLQQEADPLTLLQAEHSLAQAQESKTSAESNITKGYEDAFNSVSDAFLDLPTIITELYNVLYAKDVGEEAYFGGGYWNTDALMNTVGNWDYVDKLTVFQKSAASDYITARAKYDANFTSYKNATRYSDQETVENLLDETIETVKAMAQSAKSSSNYLDAWVDMRTKQDYKIFSKVTEHQDLLASYMSKVNSHLSSLISIQKSLTDNKEAVVDAERTIEEKTASLTDLQDGADPLDLEAQKISVQQKVNSLLDAQEKLADYTARAQFDGVVADFDVKVGNTVSANTSVGTLLTEQKVATISLNESDIVKVKVGQKATLTFDAVEDLSITGTVAEVDALGTVSQGVVSYEVKIVFDVQDDRVKQNMSVNAEIILSSKSDVLLVSSSAVKTSGTESYVQVLIDGVPQKKTVVVGDSNDMTTEITSGLSEGEEIVTQTIKSSSSSSASSSKTTNKSSTSIMGGMMGGGGPPQ